MAKIKANGQKISAYLGDTEYALLQNLAFEKNESMSKALSHAIINDAKSFYCGLEISVAAYLALESGQFDILQIVKSDDNRKVLTVDEAAFGNHKDGKETGFEKVRNCMIERLKGKMTYSVMIYFDEDTVDVVFDNLPMFDAKKERPTDCIYACQRSFGTLDEAKTFQTTIATTLLGNIKNCTLRNEGTAITCFSDSSLGSAITVAIVSHFNE